MLFRSGAGHSLFDFILRNKNGFLIVFESPFGSFIGRAIGFRNGNTVFLNSLSSSCDENYTNIDLINACTTISKMIIEKSLNSSCPIENVVIHREYAMKSVDDNRILLNVSKVNEGLGTFHIDIGSFVHVLATTSNDKFVPVNLDNSCVPTYKPARELVKINDERTLEQINKVNRIKEIIEGKEYDNVEPITEIIYGIAGEDFYVYIDEFGNLKCNIITRDERALKEYYEALEKVKEYLSSLSCKQLKYVV